MTTQVFRATQAIHGVDATHGPATVFVDKGRVTEVVGEVLEVDVVKQKSLSNDVDIIDVPSDEVLIPGLVDTHVHVNEPGRTDWEGFASVTRAAAAGGVTTLLDMPLNSIPSTVTVDALAVKQDVARDKARVNVGFWGGAVPENLGTGDLKALWDAGVFGFKCFLLHSGVDEFAPLNKKQLHAAMEEIAEFDGLLIVHAEDADAIEAGEAAVNADGGIDETYETFLASRPADAEAKAIASVIESSEATGCRAHILHLSESNSLAQIQEAKARGVRITAETCPHYLSLFAEEIQNGATQFKCCPPIRTAGNREQLWKGLVDGVIDMVVSDHSPCTAELKRFEEIAESQRKAGEDSELAAFSALAAKGTDLGGEGADGRGTGGSFGEAWGGISSVQLGLPVIWSQARVRGLSLPDVLTWMSTNPAAWAGLDDRGAISPGKRADLVTISADDAFVVLPEKLHQKNKLSAYAQRALAGVVTRTWVGGELVYRRPLTGEDASDSSVFPGTAQPFTVR